MIGNKMMFKNTYNNTNAEPQQSSAADYISDRGQKDPNLARVGQK